MNNYWLRRNTFVISVERNNSGVNSGVNNWYILKFYPLKSKRKYLHKDGTWHESTKDKNGDWSGYYETEEEAQITLNKALI